MSRFALLRSRDKEIDTRYGLLSFASLWFIYGLPPLPPTSDLGFVCLGFRIVSLWFCVLGFGLRVCVFLFRVFGVCRFVQIA